jgi:hypothetical protein
MLLIYLLKKAAKQEGNSNKNVNINSVRTTSFWNNPHQVCSKWKDWKAVIMVPVPLMVNGDHGQVEPVLLPVVMDSRQGVTYVTILPQPMVELLVKDQTVRFWPVTVVPVLV